MHVCVCVNIHWNGYQARPERPFLAALLTIYYAKHAHMCASRSRSYLDMLVLVKSSFNTSLLAVLAKNSTDVLCQLL